ncbi:hypothetical protein [Sphingobacterium sp. CZ-2]|uniref:hypothetical protein n=1 Tax=Sphingobacterium sp. CZ-2 TaxID=2557994 RepID=UPI00106F53B9|nr:hypothetical protein [Sphingobacterium sp. CZ-2]QBR13255.1 hypothetical protein E3D81_14210 [Sphingobacterium sp. CZ-2]
MMKKIKNYGFEIQLNGEEVARIGIEKENYVLSCLITAVPRIKNTIDLNLEIGGLEIDEDVSVSWEGRELKVGDKLDILVIDEGFNNPDYSSVPVSKEEKLKQKLTYFYELKEELGDLVD